MLNLGCGRIILPGDKPAHHTLVRDDIYTYPEWVNVDKNMQPGVDKVMDLFCYPWDLPSDSFSGALLSHVAEHIPHEIATNDSDLSQMQDGWFAFFSELWRVLEHGSIVHVLSPYGHSTDAISDPTHTRYLTEFSLRHSMQPNPDAPFEYNHKLHFDIVENWTFRPMGIFAHEPYIAKGIPTEAFFLAKQTMNNVIREFYTQLVCIKE